MLTPCGKCQERLLYWGNNVKVTVTNDSGNLEYKTLKGLPPFHWTNASDDIEYKEVF